MAQVTLDLPNTLHDQLEGLAQYEGIQLKQYILYVLAQQADAVYKLHQLPEDAVEQQESHYMALRDRWGSASPEQVKSFLAEREIVAPEPELSTDLIDRVREKINAQK